MPLRQPNKLTPEQAVEKLHPRYPSQRQGLLQELDWFLRDYAETLDDSPHPRLDGIHADLKDVIDALQTTRLEAHPVGNAA